MHTGIITTVVGSGLGDGRAATSAQFLNTSSVASDSIGNLFIVDYYNSRIRRVDMYTGIITTVAGIGIAGFSGDGGPAINAQINGALNIAIDPAGNLFIADLYNHRIRKVDMNTGIITTVAGTGVAGFSGDAGPATSAKLQRPVDIAFDTAGNMFISDFYNHRVRKIDVNSGIITTVAGTGTWGFSGDGGAATSAQFNTMWSIAVDAAGNLFIADTNNHRIRRVDVNTGIINTVVGTGVAGFSGDGGAASSAQINTGRNLSFDAAGNLFIADQENHRIRIVDVNGTISTFAGTGIAGFSGDGGAATRAQLVQPTDITFDRAGNVFIADNSNNRIRKVAMVNVAPRAVNDTVIATGATVTTGNVLANDYDPDGYGVNIVAFDANSVQGGTVVNNGNGTFTYTAPTNIRGSDSFTYTITDSHGASARATVNIPVPSPIIWASNGPFLVNGDVLSLSINFHPGLMTGRLVDVYITIIPPAGTPPISMKPANILTFSVAPYAANSPMTAYSGNIFNYTLGGSEPSGQYSATLFFTEPGTTTPVGPTATTHFYIFN